MRNWFLFPKTPAVFGFPQMNNCDDRSYLCTMMVPSWDTWVFQEHWKWLAASTGGTTSLPLPVTMLRVATLVLGTRSVTRNPWDYYNHCRYLRDLGFGLSQTSLRNSHHQRVSMPFTS